jgi:methyl-accepting chemotaxis protein
MDQKNLKNVIIPMIAKLKKTMSSRSLMVTLAIYFFALSLVVLLIAGGLQIYFNFQNQQKVIFAQQQFIAREAAYNVRGFIQEKIGILESSVILSGLVDSQKEEQKFVLEKLIGTEPSFRQLVLFNTQGKEILRESRVSNLVLSQLTEHIGDEIFSQTSQGETYISPAYIEEITSEPQVIIAVPVKDVFGDFKGTLIAEVNLKFMWDLVGMLKIGKSGVAYVVDRDGNLIAFGDISRVLRGENLAHLDEVNKFVNYIDSSIESEIDASQGILGTDVVDSHVQLGVPDWAVVVELPASEAYETVTQGVSLSLGIIVINAILAVMVGFYLSKRISKPIKKLTKNIEDISMGKLDTEIDPKLKESKDEIGNLARAFDRTLVSLKLAMRKKRPEKEDYN